MDILAPEINILAPKMNILAPKMDKSLPFEKVQPQCTFFSESVIIKKDRLFVNKTLEYGGKCSALLQVQTASKLKTKNILTH